MATRIIKTSAAVIQKTNTANILRKSAVYVSAEVPAGTASHGFYGGLLVDLYTTI